MVKDILVSLALLMIFLVPGAVFGGGYPTVVITDAPDGGLVMAPITESALRIVNNGFSDERFSPSVIAEDGSAVPSQYVDGRLLLMELTPEQVAESRSEPGPLRGGLRRTPAGRRPVHPGGQTERPHPRRRHPGPAEPFQRRPAHRRIPAGPGLHGGTLSCVRSAAPDQPGCILRHPDPA